MSERPAAILDLDGTLVDTNYHHALAWYRALRQHGRVVPMWRIHRHIGMGGDFIVAALVDEAFDREHGDDVRAAEKPLYKAVIEETEPLDGAQDLVRALKERGHPVVLASSAKADELDYYIDLLGVRDVVDGWTSSADAEASKPEPDIITAALEKIGRPPAAVMIGDSTWDCIAAGKAGVPTIGVLTGGFSEQELREAGAVAVFEDLRSLIEGLSRTPLGA